MLQVRAGIRDPIVFDRTMTFFLDHENRRWVVTPRRFVNETFTYDLEVRVNVNHKVCNLEDRVYIYTKKNLT